MEALRRSRECARCGAVQDYVRFILTRRNTRNGLVYREDPTILAWDLINEPRCETWKVRRLCAAGLYALGLDALGHPVPGLGSALKP